MSKESKDLRAKRFKMIEDAQALNPAKGMTAEVEVQFDALMTDADALLAKITRIERDEERMNSVMEGLRANAETRGTDPEQERDSADLAKSTFRAYVRGGVASMNAAQNAHFQARFQAAAGTSPDTSGGYLVPPGFYDQLIDAQLAYGGMMVESYVFDTATGNALPIPTDNDTANKGFIIGENKQVPDAVDVALGAITLNAYTYSSGILKISNQLLNDSVFNLDAFMSGRIGIRLARVINDHATSGNGAGQPTGAVTAASLGFTAGGASNSGSTATVTFDDLEELEHSVDPAYRNGAKFMFHDLTLKQIKKLKDGIGRPLWLAGLAVKEPDTINGYAYSVNQSMPVQAASAKSILFGNLKNYYIRRVAGVQLLRLTERYADVNQTAFVAFQRLDGNLIDAGTHPVKYLQQSAT